MCRKRRCYHQLVYKGIKITSKLIYRLDRSMFYNFLFQIHVLNRTSYRKQIPAAYMCIDLSGSYTLMT